jgi:ubiquinone/menaquinone biosynthesis C-methylase UbiE
MPHKSHDRKLGDFENSSRTRAWFYSLFSSFYGRTLYAKQREYSDFKGNESILDFGSGPGHVSKRIIDYITPNGTLTCLDVSKEFLKICRKKLKNYSNVTFLFGDIRNLEIPSKTYDLIYINFVLHHVNEEIRMEIADKLIDILKPGGKIIILEFPGKNHGLTEEKLQKLFRSDKIEGNLMFENKNGIVYQLTKHS